MKKKKQILATMAKIDGALQAISLHFPDGERVGTGYSIVVRGAGYTKVYRVERIDRRDEFNVATLAPATPDDEVIEPHRRISKKRGSDGVADFMQRHDSFFGLPKKKGRKDS